MTSKTDNSDAGLFTSRRKLVRSMAVGSGAITGLAFLPEKWTKPVIEVVYLPAHAAVSQQESGTTKPTSTPGSPTPTSTSTPIGPTNTPTPTSTSTPVGPTNTPTPD